MPRKFNRPLDILKFVPESKNCWPWSGNCDRDGYGLWKINNKTVRAHRFLFTTLFGEIGSGLVMDHLCRNRKCMNPLHLEAVTVKTNTLRGNSIQAMNKAKTHCKRGHEFTEENIYRTNSGSRSCRKCGAMHQRLYTQRRKQK